MAYLLQQTDEYIESLIEMVKQHKEDLKKLKKRRKSSRRQTVSEVCPYNKTQCAVMKDVISVFINYIINNVN